MYAPIALFFVLACVTVSSSVPPPSLDWRDKGAVTPVKDQKLCGSYWAFASVAALEGIGQIRSGNLVVLSEQEIIDCGGVDNPCVGANFGDAYGFVLTHGLTSSEEYPYKAMQECTAIDKPSSFSVILTGYVFVSPNNETDLLLAVAHQPVVALIDPTLFRSYNSGVITGPCRNDLTHAVTIVGYGTTEDGVQYWTVKNSWGDSFGEGGYAWLQRNIEDLKGTCGIAMYAAYP